MKTESQPFYDRGHEILPPSPAGRTELGPGLCFCPTPSHLPWGEDEQERCGFPYSFKAFFFGFTVAEASQPSARCLVGTSPQLHGHIPTKKHEPPCCQAPQLFIPASSVPLGAHRKFWKVFSLGIGCGIRPPSRNALLFLSSSRLTCWIKYRTFS